MSKLVEQARKYKTWQLLHSMTGSSKSHCKKVALNERSQETTAGKLIMQKLAELEEVLIN